MGAHRTKKLSKEAILNEAKRLFSTKGYRGTTLEDLTQKFGVSRPSLYYYFKSKIDILTELHSLGFQQAAEEVDSIINSDLPTTEKFEKLLEAHARTITEDTALQKVFFLDANEMPKKLVARINERRKEYTQKMIGIFEQGIREGKFVDIEPKIAVYLLLGACNWITMWYNPKKKDQGNSIVKSLMTLLRNGYETRDT